MALQLTLFPRSKRPSPRVLAKSDDQGEFTAGRWTAHFACRCGWQAWLSGCTATEVRRGLPCPECNEGVSYD